MTQVSHKNEVLKGLVMLGEFVLLNLFMVLLVMIRQQQHLLFTILLLWNISYLFSIFMYPPKAYIRLVRVEEVATCSLQCTLMSGLMFCVLLFTYDRQMILGSSIVEILLIGILVFLIVFFNRWLCKYALKMFRARGRNTESVVFVGAGLNLRALYDSMAQDVSTGYRIRGYFENADSEQFVERLPRLGTLQEVTSWLGKNKVNMLFCNLPSSQEKLILEIMNYCENHLVHFYSVPNVRNYVHHSMQVQFVNDIPVLSLRLEPLRKTSSRIVKRLFDIVFSLVVIVCLLWWFTIIVAIITKITMPGPLFFKQKRNGLNGKEFYCLKFRSMKVNDNADKVQATENDARITRWGRIMRKTNIDELPQFFNVLMGDMSIVGPRPHMVLHNDEYGRLIDKYMVRHYAKPGITGWAQVTGSRGETKDLKDMEERIHKDVWYVENWTFMLDIRIILMTVFNMLGGEKGNAY